MPKTVPAEDSTGRLSGRSRPGVVRKAMSLLLILLATAFLVRILAPEMANIRESAATVRWPRIAIASLALVPMCFLKAWYHFYLLERLSGNRIALRIGLPIYLQSQIVRYLPGTIWGMVYQSQRLADTHRTSEVVIANLWQMATTNLLSIGVIVSILLSWNYSPAWLLLLIPSVALVEGLHRYPIVESWVLKQLGRFLPRFAPLAAGRMLPPMRWKGTAILCAEWMFYFLSFVVLLQGSMDWHKALLLATWYSGASVISLVAFVVPAGIAVREAVFVAVPGLIGIDTATLAIVAVLARVTSLLGEIMAALLASLAKLGIRDEPA